MNFTKAWEMDITFDVLIEGEGEGKTGLVGRTVFKLIHRNLYKYYQIKKK